MVQGADAEEAADAGRVDRDRGGAGDPGGAQHEDGAEGDRDEERVLVQDPAQAGLASSGTGMRSIGDTVPGGPRTPHGPA